MTETENPNPEVAARLQARGLMRASVLPIALSIVVGIGTALLDLRVGVGIVAALVVAAIALLIQLTIQISSADLKAQIQLDELSAIARLRSLDDTSGDFLLALANSQLRYLESGPDRPVVFDLELDHRRRMLLEQYEECARGTMRLNLRPASILRETDGVSTVNRELKATSVVPAGPYWGSPNGLSYLKQQEDMLDRGVSIRRVFIQREAKLGDLASVVQRHLDWRDRYGSERLDLRIALIDTLNDELVADYAIIDDSSVIRLEIQHGLDQPTTVTWNTSPNDVEATTRLYERLWASANDPTDFPTLAR